MAVGQEGQAQSPEVELPIAEGSSVLAFAIGEVHLAVPADLAEEVCDRGETIPIPGAPSHIAGLINVRGRVVPLLDLAAFFGLPPIDEQARAHDDRPPRALIVSSGDLTAALDCERVLGLEHLASDDLGPVAPGRGERLTSHAMAEVSLERGLLLVLDLPGLLSSARVVA